ncbi:hypothetical protein CP10139811_0143 [Chlamydia ibidis]|uniref:Uncharacterized protein n=2 Tax=Chlamydia ibidis TaxID=1405396 RepID=S7J4Z7_9CHLA|nr:hypothetical protein CP10139811_0143 [Chlamydia ibidis]EQM62652.1 hypothetical protein H359_0585 [Chlamydia ibidis 10-1398/6]
MYNSPLFDWACEAINTEKTSPKNLSQQKISYVLLGKL